MGSEYGVWPKYEHVAMRIVYLVTSVRVKISSTKCKNLKLRRCRTTVTNEISTNNRSAGYCLRRNVENRN